MTKVKICGTTSPEDACLAQEAGADFLGVIINYPRSPRSVSLECAIEIADSTLIPIIALCVNASFEEILKIQQVLNPYAFQLHGDESPALVRELVAYGLRVWKAICGDYEALKQDAQMFIEAGVEALIVDARAVGSDGVTVYGGTGHLSDWEAAKKLRANGFRIFLAGGLEPDNVAEAIKAVEPYGVDVVSGVEATKGVKDPLKVSSFLEAARTASEVS